MNPTDDKRAQSPAPEQHPATPPAQKLKRFRLVRLEERIAPKSGGSGPPFTAKCRDSW